MSSESAREYVIEHNESVGPSEGLHDQRLSCVAMSPSCDKACQRQDVVERARGTRGEGSRHLAVESRKSTHRTPPEGGTATVSPALLFVDDSMVELNCL